MTIGPQSSTAPRTLGDLNALCQSSHIGIPDLEQLIADGHLAAAHALPNGVVLFDLHPNRISQLQEIHETRRPKFRL
jgi:hypothetical protein